MTRNLVLWTLAFTLGGFLAAEAQVQNVAGAGTPLAAEAGATAPNPAAVLAIQPTDRVMGKPTAPVLIVEYASMTCAHCRDFANHTMSQVEKNWVETGKAAYVLRHLPWDDLALAEALTMYCAPPASYYPLARAFFGAQEAIMKAPNPLQEVKQIARFAGLDDAAVQGCITDPDGHAFLTDMRTTAQRDLGMTGTPTTFINGERVNGAESYDKLEKILKKAYKQATGT